MNKQTIKELKSVVGYDKGNVSQQQWREIKNKFSKLAHHQRRPFLDTLKKIDLSKVAEQLAEMKEKK